MDNTAIILPILQRIPLFAELDADQHKAIISNIQLQFYPAEYSLFNQGDPGEAMYIIKSGTVQIFHPSQNEDEDPEPVKDLKQNDFFGEMALISNKPRNASAKTLEDTEVFMLTKSDFMNLLSTNKSLAGQISKEFIQRLKENDN